MSLALAAKKSLAPMWRSSSNGMLDLAECAHPAGEGAAVTLAQPLARDGASRHRRRRGACRRTPAATRVTQAVLAPVGVVGVAGAEGVQQVAVILAALVGVLDQQRDRRAGGQAFVDARQDLHPVGFLALRDVAAGAGATAVELGLDVGFGQRQAGRAAVDDAADRRAVALAEIGDAKEFAEGAAGHGNAALGAADSMRRPPAGPLRPSAAPRRLPRASP